MFCDSCLDAGEGGLKVRLAQAQVPVQPPQERLRARALACLRVRVRVCARACVFARASALACARARICALACVGCMRAWSRPPGDPRAGPGQGHATDAGPRTRDEARRSRNAPRGASPSSLTLGGTFAPQGAKLPRELRPPHSHSQGWSVLRLKRALLRGLGSPEGLRVSCA